MHLDQVLEQLNPYGPYQILNWLVVSLFATFPPAWHQFGIIFTGYFPSKYGCVSSNSSESVDEFVSQDGKISYRTVFRSPVEGQPCMVSVSRYSDNSSTAVLVSTANETCSSDFWYSPDDPVKSTIITQWDLVCSREILSVIISSAEGFGEVIGCIVFGYVADRLGRKISLFSSAATLFCGGILCAFAPHPAVAIIARVIIGVSLTGMLNIGFLMNIELFTPNARTIFATGGELVWAIAILSLTAVGYIFREAFWFMIAITVPILLIIPAWWFLRESIHWQLTNGKVAEASCTLRRIAKFNKVTIDEELLEKVLESEAEALRRKEQDDATKNGNTVAIANTNDNYELEQNNIGKQQQQPLMASHHTTDASKGEKGVGEKKPGVLDLFRTRTLRMITIFLTLLWFANTICYYGLQMAAQLTEGVDFYVSFAILAAVEIPALYVYCVELFPTPLRGTGFGLVSVIGRIGMVIAPFINSLGYGESSNVFPTWARMVIYGTALIATGFLTLPLPETNHHPLAETIEQIENYEQYCKDYESEGKKAKNKVLAAESGHAETEVKC